MPCVSRLLGLARASHGRLYSSQSLLLPFLRRSQLAFEAMDALVSLFDAGLLRGDEDGIAWKQPQATGDALHDLVGKPSNADRTTVDLAVLPAASLSALKLRCALSLESLGRR
jgi:hypothetical protein